VNVVMMAATLNGFWSAATARESPRQEHLVFPGEIDILVPVRSVFGHVKVALQGLVEPLVAERDGPASLGAYRVPELCALL
jgi:hypothetical protein